MRYWRLFFVSFLLTFSIAGCHRKPERALPPSHAQAPIVNPLPTLPPLALHDVQLEQSKPVSAAVPPHATVPPRKRHTAKVRHRRTPPKGGPETAPTETQPGTSGSGAAASATAVIGQLSADDSTATPTEAAQTKRLIDSTEVQLKKLPTQQRTKHKDAVAQANSFLAQARQALSMNDMVGAQTLANKAKILIDELSK